MVVNMFADPEVIYTASDSSFRSLHDVIVEAKKGNGTWGTTVPTAPERLVLEQLKQAADVDPALVTHDGGGDLLINVLNGTLQIGVGEVQEIQSQLEAGQLRLLASLTADRLDQFAKVPTAKELGYDVEIRKFRRFAAPQDLPDSIIRQWERAIQAVLQEPNYRAYYEGANLLPDFIAHEDYGALIERYAAETERGLTEACVVAK